MPRKTSTLKSPTQRSARGAKRSHAVKKAGLSADQRAEINASLGAYGARLTDDDRIAKGDKVMSVQLEAKDGRLKMVGGGNVLATYPAGRAGQGVSDFVEKFWFWRKDATASAHATKKTKKSPAQLQRDIDEALSRRKPRRFAPGDPNTDDYLRFLDDVNDPPRTDLIRAHKDERARESHATQKSAGVRRPRTSNEPFWIAPADKPRDRYAAGYDGNHFRTRTEAQRSIAAMRALGGEFDAPWVINEDSKAHATKRGTRKKAYATKKSSLTAPRIGILPAATMEQRLASMSTTDLMLTARALAKKTDAASDRACTAVLDALEKRISPAAFESFTSEIYAPR